MSCIYMYMYMDHMLYTCCTEDILRATWRGLSQFQHGICTLGQWCASPPYLGLVCEVSQQFLTVSAHDVGGDEEVVDGPVLVVEFVDTELEIGDGGIQLWQDTHTHTHIYQ